MSTPSALTRPPEAHAPEPRAAGLLPAAIRRHGSVLTNAGSLAVTTVATSGLGVLFWAIATQRLPAEQVGRDAALVSAMNLAATVAIFGLGSLLIAELPTRPDSGGRLIAAVVCGTAASGLLLGAVWLGGLLTSGQLAGEVRHPLLAVAFVAGVAVTAVTLVLDQATIGLLLGALQMWRNLVMGLIKPAMLIVLLAVGLRDGAVTLSWVVGTALSVPIVAVLARRSRHRFWGRPDLTALRALRRAGLDHTLLTLSLTAPRLAMPLIVATAVSARANAAFYVAWMVASMLYLVPGHLSTVLFAIGRGRYDELRAKLRFTLGLSFALGLPLSLAVAVFARPVLHLFGGEYAAAGTVPLIALAAAFPANVVKQHYVAVARVEDRLVTAWRLMSACALVEVVVVAVAGRLASLDAAVYALVAVMMGEGLLTLRGVRGALRPRPGPVEGTA